MVEESVQHEKVDDPGEENEGKGVMKPVDDKKGRGSSIKNESQPTASETNSNPTNVTKTNKQNNNSANITNYFKQTNRVKKKWSNIINFVSFISFNYYRWNNFIAFDKKIETWSRNKDFIDISVVLSVHLVSQSVKEHFNNALVTPNPLES